MMRLPFLFLALILSLIGGNLDAASSFLKAPPAKKVLLNEVVILRPLEKHHFNLKAPQSCGAFRFQVKTPEELRCQLTGAGLHEIRVSICDDRETFCKTETHLVNVETAKGTKAGEKGSTALRKFIPTKKKDKNGFLENNPEYAQELAQKKSQRILFDFSAEWCPSCNGLEEIVFSSKEFQAATKNIIKVKIDIDRENARPYEKRFRVQLYPTMIITDAELKEIDRYIGYTYLPASEVVSWINQTAAEKANLDEAEKMLSTSANKLPKAEQEKIRLRLARARSSDPGFVIRLLEGSESPEEKREYFLARYRESESSSDQKKMISSLQALIAKFPEDVDFAYWVLNLNEIDHSLAAPLFEKAIKSASNWKSSPKLNARLASAPGLSEAIGEIYLAMKNEEKAKAAFSEAADLLVAAASKSTHSIARGPNLDRAYYLLKAGRDAEAKKIYAAMADEYRDEYVFNYRYAKVLYNLKDYEQADQYAARALKNSYGEGHYYAAALLAEIQIAEGKKPAAKKNLETVLKLLTLPPTENSWEHRALARIREVLSRLN